MGMSMRTLAALLIATGLATATITAQSAKLPPGAMYVSCSDWYWFGRGITIKSLLRPGTGCHVVRNGYNKA